MSYPNDIDTINICGNSNGGHCGYCNNNYTSKYSYGFLCDTMKPETYFNLMNRGWRRCGTYFYKPINETTCCPLYTIRCDATDFQLSKSQRKVLKNFRKFLMFGKDLMIKKKGSVNPNQINERGDEILLDDSLNSFDNSTTKQSKSLSKNDKSRKAKNIRYNLKLEKLKRRSERENKSYEEMLANYQTLRIERLKKLKSKSLSEYLDYSNLISPKHTLVVKTIRSNPEIKDFIETKNAEHKIYVKYQCSIHNDSLSDVDIKQFERFLIKGGIYHSKTSDFIDLTNSRRNLPQGQYHQQYWLDGNQLIAVGVIDIVPYALSSVYLFYDPDFSFLNLGVYSALLEINFINELRTNYSDPDFRFYYMGFYTHNCIKMRYKAQYHGSMLLCPITNSWVPVKICQEILNKTKFSRFLSEKSVKDNFSLQSKSIDQLSTMINVIVSGKVYKLKRFISKLSPEFLSILEEFCKLVGSQILPNLKIALT